MAFNKWFDTFIEEKGIDLNENFYFYEGELAHIVEIGTLAAYVKNCYGPVKAKIKNTLVMIDFKNGDVKHYLKFLAKGMVNVNYEGAA